MPKRATTHPEPVEVTRELQESVALLKGGTLSLKALRLRSWRSDFFDSPGKDATKPSK